MKTILHLCADIGSDSEPYRKAGYNVICVGKDIGVENYHPPEDVYGVIANPPCTEFSTARSNGRSRHNDIGMILVKECQRIIQKAEPKFWVIENPATGDLKRFLGKTTYQYQPWWFGSPWTKRTALWGKFNIPKRVYSKWEDVPKIAELYTRPNRGKPSLAFMHCKAHMKFIPEFQPFFERLIKEPSRDKVNGRGSDMSFRSLCSQKFAQAFYIVGVIADELIKADLSDETKKMIVREIKEMIVNENALGMECDRKDWIRVMEKFIKDLT